MQLLTRTSLLLFSGALLLSGCDGAAVVDDSAHTYNATSATNADNPDGAAHSHGISQIEPGIWPPVLTHTVNQRALPPSIKSRGANIVIASARDTILNNPQVRNALGPNFAEFEASPGNTKTAKVANFVFYNYSTNTTVEVALNADTGIEIQHYPASVFQPTEGKSEVEQAISLGSQHLQQSGFNLGGLKGTAMLAFPTLSELANNAHQFYPERVLYVTFGKGNGQEPEYRALVNISQQLVIEAAEIL